MNTYRPATTAEIVEYLAPYLQYGWRVTFDRVDGRQRRRGSSRARLIDGVPQVYYRGQFYPLLAEVCTYDSACKSLVSNLLIDYGI